MATEKDLNAPDFTGNAASAAGALAIAATAKGQSPWLRRLLYLFMAIIMLAVLAGGIDKLVNIDTLPGCDAQRTRDTLSDLNKANQVNASSYNFIKEVSKAETEIRCTANLALRAGGTLEYDYRIFREGKEMRVEITETRNP